MTQLLKAAYIFNHILEVRRTSPLIHNITNFVAMNFSANALLALGASPVISHAVDEVEEMLSHSQALVLNMGTLDTGWIACAE